MLQKSFIGDSSNKSFIRVKKYGEFATQIKDIEAFFNNYKVLSTENQEFFKNMELEKLEEI